MKKTNFYYANLIYFIIILGFVAIRILTYFDVLSLKNGAEDYIFSTLLQVGLMLILPITLYSFFSKKKISQTLNYFGVKKISVGSIFLAIAIGIIVYILNICVASFFNFVIQFFGYEKLSSATTSSQYPLYMLFVNLAMTALLPAICEEITHRGLLLKNYSTLGFKKAIIFSGLLFGLTHLNIEQFFFASIIGFLLGFITVLCGNIIPAMIIHFMNNAINVLVSYFLATNSTFNTYYEMFFNKITTGNFFTVIISIFFVISTLFILLVFLVFKLFQTTAVKDLKKVTEELSRQKLREELMGEVKPEIITDKVPMLIQRENKFFNIYVPTDSIGYPLKQQYFPPLKEKAVFYGMFTLTFLITIFSFVCNII